jgi:hypothetical protein
MRFEGWLHSGLRNFVLPSCEEGNEKFFAGLSRAMAREAPFALSIRTSPTLPNLVIQNKLQSVFNGFHVKNERFRVFWFTGLRILGNFQIAI